ncbi:sensor domain-containing diguanylate cyclase [Caldimonas tepidiphila]|uniref:sensor domain-containing diguanylate cyclase n=1 Tax=Caldimonas tepidiphila TaxID=2315841 RepID=UPI00147496EB|nr:diguanylate cyclase [Caldimonas tepidiphila]
MISAEETLSADVLEQMLRQAHARGCDDHRFLQHLQLAVEPLRAGVFAKDPQGRYLFVNQAAADVIGLPAAQIVGRRDTDIFPAELAHRIVELDRSARSQRRALECEEALPAPGQPGLERDFFSVRVPVSQRESDPLQPLCGIWIEITELRRTQDQLRQALAQLQHDAAAGASGPDGQVRDPLTGVYARGHFEEQVRREIEVSLREHREFALVTVEVDAFDALIGEHGVAAGERVLQALGLQLRASTRAMDAPCRLGDERFAVLLSGIGLATAHARMENVRRQCEALPVMHEGREIRFTVSVGVACFPHTTARPDALLPAAERALAQARERGANTVALASISFDAPAAGLDEPLSF